jgi:hypothetical protein
MTKKTNKTFTCPVCMEQVPAHAHACPHCGADEQTGWSESTYLDGIDVDEEIDYDEILENEFPSKKPKPVAKLNWIVIVAIVLLILSFGGFMKMILK